MNELAKHFGSYFIRQGYTVIEFDDRIEFENYFCKGKITTKKPFTVTFKCKRGYELLDIPCGVGNISSQSSSVGGMMSFLQRRLVIKSK